MFLQTNSSVGYLRRRSGRCRVILEFTAGGRHCQLRKGGPMPGQLEDSSKESAKESA
jgi:hypothetical protein